PARCEALAGETKGGRSGDLEQPPATARPATTSRGKRARTIRPGRSLSQSRDPRPAPADWLAKPTPRSGVVRHRPAPRRPSPRRPWCRPASEPCGAETDRLEFRTPRHSRRAANATEPRGPRTEYGDESSGEPRTPENRAARRSGPRPRSIAP